MTDRAQTRGTRNAAIVCALCTIACQIAAKATRDALFLSTFDITLLPPMLIVASTLTVLAVWYGGAVMVGLVYWFIYLRKGIVPPSDTLRK